MPNLLDALSRRRAALASGAMLTAAAVTVSTLALVYQGIATADVSLDDGGVWVTKTDDLLVGHLNYPSRVLDDSVRARAPQFDILQDGGAVLLEDSANATLSVLDTARIELAGEAALPASARVALGGTTVGIVGGGGLFGLSLDAVSGASFAEDSALAAVGEDAAVAVTRDGAEIFAASVGAASLLRVRSGGTAADVETIPLEGLSRDAEIELSAVGTTPVVLDRTSGDVYVSDRRIALPGAVDGRLQQTGADAEAVYIATPTALLRQPLDGSPATTVAEVDSGVPAAPVWLNGCAYAVWGGSGAYVRDCVGEADDLQTQIDVPEGSTLTLRMNRRVVVVNDVSVGTVWVVTQDVERVENWDDVVPPPDANADEEESQEEQPQFDLPERSAENTPPTAVEDEFGVRAGRASILRVTDNDTDLDGDLLSARVVGAAPSGWELTPVLGGAAIQASVPANASGSIVFTYEVDDGRDGTDQAPVTVTVRGDDVNGAPAQTRVNTLQVEAGATITYAALDGWSDPDGDDFYLTQATVQGGDTLTFRSNGIVEYTAASGIAGLKEVALTVSDGREEATGVLRVDVRPPGSLAPIANADRVTTTSGVPVVVSPLLNDLSPSGQALRLAKHDSRSDARITPDFAAGTFEFVAEAPGSYYVQYLVTDGPRSAVGIVRIDVLPAAAGGQPPVAVRDVALLPGGRDVLVDVLANDSDPGGGILLVQSARALPGAGVSVEVLDHRALRISDLGGLSAPVTLTYAVSNGEMTATGEVLVLPVPLPATLRPPVAVEDRAVVRAGDVVTIPVLANDFHPDNDTITLLPQLVDTDAGPGDTVFVAGDRLRFQSGGEPGTVRATYEITDSQQNRTAGYVTIQVLPADSGTNSAPRATSVIARVIAGNTVRIPIPLDGIDPDGDSVELIGATSTAAKGRVTTGDSWLEYEAYDGASGTDRFGYAVRDRLGAVAEATITVGISAPGVDNQPPYAVKDVVTVKPGRRVAVAVTANDSDPDGDDIAVDPQGLVVPDGVDATVEGGRVVVTAPQTAGEYTLTYAVADVFGAVANGVLLLVVDPEAAPAAPIARDDRVQPSAVDARGNATIAVLANDEDPDGTTGDLSVEVFDPAASATRDGRVTLAVEETSRIVRYAITDADGLTAQAFVFVPGLSTVLPSVSTTEPITVVSGETVTIPLADSVSVRAGREPRIAVADSVRTGRSNGAPLIRDEFTLEYTSADGYFGADAIGLLVTDGTGPDDPAALSAFVTIPIRVLPTENQPPTIRNAAVSVAPGEEAVTLNLARLSADPDEGDEEKLTFGIDGSVSAGYTATVSGATLTVSAAASVPAGSSSILAVRVTDGVTAPVTGTVTLNAVVSQRPFAVANDDVVSRADQGRPQTVDVLSNDFNPFEGESPLTIVGTRVLTGDGQAAVSGDRVVVTPAASFTGTMIVAYRIADATAAPERQAEGRVIVTVQGRPAAPTTPTVTSIQDRTVVLSWAPPANNGAAITGYDVSSSQGYTKACASTTCTLDGLVNDVEYAFTVVAINEVGRSDPSPASAPARPDARPDAPAPPSLVFGDRSLAVSWATPRSNGSPVLSYTLEISPAPATGPIQRTGVTGNALVWDGLQNGVAYQVRVQAVNRAPDPSEWSAYSATAVPAGVPSAPGAPTTIAASPVGGQAQITVSWSAPADDNGDRVSSYTLSVKRGGSVVNTLEGLAVTSQNVVVDTNETDYTFSVTARNKAGVSAPSADSAPRRAAVAPGAPTRVVATPQDGALAVSFTPGPLNGNRAAEMTYRYRVNQTGAQGTLPSGGGTIGGLRNGTAYDVSVWATSAVEGVTPGPEATSAPAVPFGRPIITLQGIERLDGAVRFRWSVNENGRPLTQASHGGAGDNEYTATGVPAGGTATLDVSFTNEAGQTTAQWQGQANDPRPPRTWVTRSGNTVVYNWENLPPGSWPEVTQFRCWSVPPNSQQGGHAGAEGGNGAWAVSGSLSGSSGSIIVPCGNNVTDNYSVEPWKYGPWLQVGGSWNG